MTCACTTGRSRSGNSWRECRSNPPEVLHHPLP
jgi:hypothetical protein